MIIFGGEKASDEASQTLGESTLLLRVSTSQLAAAKPALPRTIAGIWEREAGGGIRALYNILPAGKILLSSISIHHAPFCR